MADKKPRSNGKATTASGKPPKAGPKRPGGRKRSGVPLMPAGSDLFSQLEQDKVSANGLQLLDELTPVICSAAPSSHQALRDMLERFMTAYVETKEQQLRINGTRRFDYALAQATKVMAGTREASYFVREAKKANMRLRQTKLPDQLVSAV